MSGSAASAERSTRKQPRDCRLFIDAIDSHAFVARRVTAHDGDRPPGNIEDFGEEHDEGVVGGAIDRRRIEADQDRVTPGAVHAGARRARDDANLENRRGSHRSNIHQHHNRQPATGNRRLATGN